MYKDSLESFILNQCKDIRHRFCMPGHKGNLNPLDVTEVGDMDNLHQPHGALKAAHARCATAYGAKTAHFVVNGSSAGVIAMLCAMAVEGKTVLLSADCHISAASALIHSGALPKMLPPNHRADGLPLPAATRDVANALNGDEPLAAVLITSPNYYGFCADIPAIASLCHNKGIPLLVDAAHGAHFGFAPSLPPQPVQADAWVVSAHKTLNVPNQGAILFVGHNSFVDQRRLWDALHTVQTTSPSWPLLCALDNAVFDLSRNGRDAYAALNARIQQLKKMLDDTPFELVMDDAAVRDNTRLILSTQKQGLSGFSAAKALQNKGIWVEMADPCHLILICAPADTHEDFKCLHEALVSLPCDVDLPRMHRQPPHGKLSLSPRSAAYGTMEPCKLAFSHGRIAARTVCCYPPGVAVVLPGQTITDGQVAFLLEMEQAGAGLMHVDNDCIQVLPKNA